MESHCPKLQIMVKFVEKKILRHPKICLLLIVIAQNLLWYKKVFFGMMTL